MAKIGEFAIAKFDGGKFDKRGRPLNYEEVPCLITGRDSSPPHWQRIIFWKTDKNGKLLVIEDNLPKNRLRSVNFTLNDVDDLLDEAAHREVTQLIKDCP